MRMAEMVSELIAAILGKMKVGDFQQSSQMLSRIYYDVLKEDASFFKSIPEAELTHKLLHEHNYTNDHLDILAQLFNAEAELSHYEGNTDISLEYSRKALILYKFIDTEQKTYSLDRIKNMDALRKRIEDIEKR